MVVILILTEIVNSEGRKPAWTCIQISEFGVPEMDEQNVVYVLVANSYLGPLLHNPFIVHFSELVSSIPMFLLVN